jgi:hypothetical protein
LPGSPGAWRSIGGRQLSAEGAEITGGSLAALASCIAFGAFEVVKPFTAKFALHLGLLLTAPKGFLEQLQYAYDPGFRASPSALVSLILSGLRQALTEASKPARWSALR